jgi:hypothetical protein
VGQTIRYTDCCPRKERNETIWVKAGIWKPRSIRKGFETGICPLILEEKNAKHVLKNVQKRKAEDKSLYI